MSWKRWKDGKGGKIAQGEVESREAG